MILISEIIDELVDYCFGEREKRILETTINGKKIGIKEQFLYYYNTACYKGTKERLFQNVLYKIHLNEHLLLQIEDFQKNISRLMDLDEYGIVKFEYNESIKGEGRIINTALAKKQRAQQADNISGSDQNNNINVSDTSTGLSETNKLETLEDVIPTPKLTDKEYSKSEFNITEENISKAEKIGNIKDVNLNNTTNPIHYQHFTKDVSIDKGYNTNLSNSSQSSDSINKESSTSGMNSARASKVDESKRTVEYLTNEARLLAWTTELPKLKQKFWHIFHRMFIYEKV